MNRIEVIEDESGTLETGYFYVIRTQDRRKVPNEAWLKSEAGKDFQSMEIVRAERTEVPLCSRNPEHKTYDLKSKEDIAYISGGGDIVACMSGLHCVSSFLDRLKESKLTGWGATECNIIDSDTPRPPKVYNIEFSQCACYRRLVFGGGFTNKCLRCGWGPVFCVECDTIESPLCPKCKDRWVDFGSADDDDIQKHKTPFYWVKPVPKKGYVLDASKWNGKDFFVGYVTGRVVRSLLNWKSWPFVAKPVRAFVDTCSKEMKEQLASVRYE